MLREKMPYVMYMYTYMYTARMEAIISITYFTYTHTLLDRFLPKTMSIVHGGGFYHGGLGKTAETAMFGDAVTRPWVR
jgi:uncharacterized membrane protein YcgQ (UPF0703/DUF1980 family)